MTQQHPFKTEPLDATFGAVVSGLTLTDLDDDAFQASIEPGSTTAC